MGDVSKLFVFKSLLTRPSNVLPLHHKQTKFEFSPKVMGSNPDYLLKYFLLCLLKFIYSEKATKFCEIFTFVLCSASQKKGEDFAKFCGLLRTYEL